MTRLKRARNYSRHALGKLRRLRRVHFLHLRKTGGTAIKEALSGHLESRKWARRGYRLFLHKHRITLSDVPEGELVFFFLRDPITRFVSGFYSRQRMGQPRYMNPWSAEEAQAFGHFDTPNALALALSSANTAEREAARHAMRNVRHIRSFYAEWYVDEAYFLSRLPDILMVGRQERLAQDFDRFKALLGLPASVCLPKEDRKSHRSPQGLDKHLSSEAEQNLRQWYARDYAFLDLCAEHADRINYGTGSAPSQAP